MKYYELIPAISGYPKRIVELTNTQNPQQWIDENLDPFAEYSYIESPDCASLFNDPEI